MRPIDADALVEAVKDYPYGFRGMIVCDIAKQPTIDPVRHGQWIPCEERLPRYDSWVIVTILDEHGDAPVRYTDFGWYMEEANCWIVDAEQRTDVTAWMPLPKPYGHRGAKMDGGEHETD